MIYGENPPFSHKNHIIAEISITNRHILTVLKGFKMNLDISHLLHNVVKTEDIAILCVNIVSFIQTLGESNAKLVRLFQIERTALINQQYNAFALLNDMRHPPIKCRLTLQILRNSIFSGINQM